MNRYPLFVAFALLAASTVSAQDWRPLFTGDLSQWDTWLGRPHKSVVIDGLKKNEKGEYDDAVGLNRDPKKVFTVVELDGGKVLRASGEIFGTVVTKEEFANYHFSLEYKWGETKWEPRLKAVRDAGILYHGVGPLGGTARNRAWTRSQECQVQENDTGDYWSVEGAICDISAVKQKEGADFVFSPGAAWETFGTIPAGEQRSRNRCIRSEMKEKPNGQWNRVDVIAVGDRAIHVVNGVVVMALKNSRHKDDTGKEVPLTKGKILLQSEGAEVFYRDIKLRPLQEMPAEYAKYFR